MADYGMATRRYEALRNCLGPERISGSLSQWNVKKVQVFQFPLQNNNHISNIFINNFNDTDNDNNKEIMNKNDNDNNNNDNDNKHNDINNQNNINNNNHLPATPLPPTQREI